MNTAPQELMKEYVQSQHFTSTAEIMTAMKEMFRDVVQTVMEVEMDEELGRERCQRAETSCAPNYRNGYTKKTVKTQLGEVDIRVPRDRNGSFEPKIIGKYSRNADGMEEKIIGLYASGMSQRDIAEQIKELYDEDYREDHAGGDGMAEPASGSGVSLRFYGRHPLQGTGRSPVCNKGGLCGSGDRHGWTEGHPRSMDRRA